MHDDTLDVKQFALMVEFEIIHISTEFITTILYFDYALHDIQLHLFTAYLL